MNHFYFFTTLKVLLCIERRLYERNSRKIIFDAIVLDKIPPTTFSYRHFCKLIICL